MCQGASEAIRHRAALDTADGTKALLIMFLLISTRYAMLVRLSYPIRNGEEFDMTLMKERAVEMIRRMPEDNMTYVINILQNLKAMSIDRNEDKKRTQNALAEILSMEKRLPDDFDPEKELREVRAEKYENIG